MMMMSGQITNTHKGYIEQGREREVCGRDYHANRPKDRAPWYRCMHVGEDRRNRNRSGNRNRNVRGDTNTNRRKSPTRYGTPRS